MDQNIQAHADAPQMGSERAFGIVFAVVFLIIALFPLWDGGAVQLWPFGVSAAFLVVAFVFPKVLQPLNWVWFKFGMVLHAIMTPLIMGIIFFLVITPTGLIMRLFGKDILGIKLDPAAKSYWIEREPPGPDADSLKNQF